jgi:gas vesicle protein
MNSLLKNTLLVSGGIVAGLITGILTAPKSGKETREELAAKIKDLQSKIEGLSGEARSQIESKIASLKETINEVEAQVNN